MSRLEEIIKTLKQYIGEGVEAALEFLETILHHDSERYNDFIQIKSRYNSLQRELLLGVLEHSTYDISRNNISKALLLLAEEITEKDLVPEDGAAEKKDDKHGEILYHVPELMQLNHEEKCTVRLAYVVDQLLRDWEKHEEDVIKNIRVSEIMAVSLLNLDESDPPFAIRTLSETVQFLDKDDFTEWVFYVKPIKTGEFPLMLRVSVIEMINNKEYKKDIVLEEQITVQSEEVPQTGEAEFKAAGTSIAVGSTPLPPQAPPAAPAAQVEKAGKKGLPKVAGALLTTAALAAAGYFGVVYYQQEVAWNDAVKTGGKAGYGAYLKKYPDGRHQDEAQMVLDSLQRIDSLQELSLLTPDEDGTAAMTDSTATEAGSEETSTPDNATAHKPPPKTSRPAVQKAEPLSVKPGPAPLPQGTPDKPIVPAATSEPLLRGKTYAFRMPKFSIVETNNQNFDIKFFQYNQYREILLVLTGLGNIKFSPGMKVALIQENGNEILSQIKYVATTPQAPDRYDGYFTIVPDDLDLVIREKVKSIRLTGSDNKSREYTLSRSGCRNLLSNAKKAAKLLEEQK